MSAPKPLRVATIGAALSANKGAASMLQSVIDNLPEEVGAPCVFDVLTTYPEEDEAERIEAPAGCEVRVVAYRPAELLLANLPLALAARAVRVLGGTGRSFCLTPALDALARADIVIDVAGISFSGGRGVPLLAYNTLMTGVPLLVGARVVKLAQALGPFDGPLTRALAKAVLGRLAAVVARGDETAAHLSELGLRNASSAADLAFAMRMGPSDEGKATALLSEVVGDEPYVAVIPSTVVLEQCSARGIDYVSILADFVRGLEEEGVRSLLFAHSARPGRPRSRMNDLPLVEALRDRVGPGCGVLEQSLPPGVLRAIIARADALVTGRFHGLISALTVATPVLVVGWSHKYREVSREFGLEEWVIDYDGLELATLRERHAALMGSLPAVRAAIEARLPAVVADARENFRVVRELLGLPQVGSA